jgi:NADPH-dependent glutamate synthase beta subunit-like oxidoreductase
MEEKIVIKSYKDVPILSVSLQSTLPNKTGTWRYLRPSYVRLQAPCSSACPLGQDISFYLTSLADGKPQEAWKKMLEANPFPAVCGRVCHHPCETDCNRKEYDEPLAINALERFLGDWGMKEGRRDNPKGEKKGKEIAIVGGGPAGLACAYFLAKRGYGAKIFEAMPQPGGMLRYGIPAYRLPRGILNREIGRIESLGVKIESGKRLGKDFGLEDLKSYDAIFMATGAWAENKPKIQGEDLKGIWHGLAFLGETNSGKHLSMGRRVVVVGGGNTAIDSARMARRMGGEVTILYRRVKDDLPAIPSEVEEAEKEGVKFLFQAVPTKASGKGGKIQAVECLKTRLGKTDASGRRTPIAVKGSNFHLKADTLILAVGERADLSFLPENIATENGRIAVDSWGRTNIPKVFAGGDAATGEGFVSSAIASGRKGAEAIDLFLQGASAKRDGSLLKTARFADINLDYFSPAARAQISSLPPEKRKKGFLEIHKGLSGANAQREAERCFSCGNCIQCNVCLMVCPDVAISFQENENKYVVDLDHCKGCGICSVECPRSAMTLEEEQWNG